jgi:polyhydroxyalkanoate synthesis regulator phasin
MRRLMWLPLAGALLVAGAAGATAAPGLVDSVGDTLAAPIARAGSFLQDVLDELVGEGVIDQDQSDAIVERVDERLSDKRAEFEARREEMLQVREQLQSFLEDDVITQAELDQLPADHPLRNIDSLLEDGQISREELAQLGRWGGPGRGLGERGHHDGPGWLHAPPADDDSGDGAQ